MATSSNGYRSDARAQRWAQWQHRTAAQWFLVDAARRQGYTLLQVPPHARDGFFAWVELLQAIPARLPDDAQTQALWQAWLTWTRRLAVYLTRVAAGKDATCPPVPPCVLEVLATEGDPDAATPTD